MKRTILFSLLLLLGVGCFSQPVMNGTILSKHPFIDVVAKSGQTYVNKDWNAAKALYADTAMWWISGLEKGVHMADAIKMWASDFDYFDNINQVYEPGTYPDYLHYKDKDLQVVQSWWIWSGKSKKTGEQVTVHMIQIDTFNKDGKISGEWIYGDFSKLSAAKQ